MAKAFLKISFLGVSPHVLAKSRLFGRLSAPDDGYRLAASLATKGMGTRIIAREGRSSAFSFRLKKAKAPV
jgi:hypothetical protein